MEDDLRAETLFATILGGTARGDDPDTLFGAVEVVEYAVRSAGAYSLARRPAEVF